METIMNHNNTKHCPQLKVIFKYIQVFGLDYRSQVKTVVTYTKLTSQSLLEMNNACIFLLYRNGANDFNKILYKM